MNLKKLEEAIEHLENNIHRSICLLHNVKEELKALKPKEPTTHWYLLRLQSPEDYVTSISHHDTEDKAIVEKNRLENYKDSPFNYTYVVISSTVGLDGTSNQWDLVRKDIIPRLHRGEY